MTAEQELKPKRYEVWPGVFVVVYVEGNWMSMPSERIKELFKTAEIFEQLAAPEPSKEPQNGKESR